MVMCSGTGGRYLAAVGIWPLLNVAGFHRRISISLRCDFGKRLFLAGAMAN